MPSDSAVDSLLVLINGTASRKPPGVACMLTDAPCGPPHRHRQATTPKILLPLIEYLFP